jgi:hypothetical protein
MNRRLLGTLSVMAALLGPLGSCKEDPLASLDGEPAAIVINLTHLDLPVGDTAAVTGRVLDGRATPLSIPLTFTACNAVVVAAVDTAYHPVPATSTRGLVIAVTPAPSCVVVRGGGLVDTVTVSALPSVFTGALSRTTAAGGDTLKIASTAQLKFDTTGGVAVTFGGGAPGTVVAVKRDTLTVLVPFSDPGPVTIDGVLVTSYTPALAVTLETSTSVTQTGDVWPVGDTSYVTAPNLFTVPPLPAVGDSVKTITNFGPANFANCAEYGPAGPPNFSTGPCVIYKFTVAGPDSLNLLFRVDWDNDADVDIYACTSAGFAGCFGEAGTSGASGRKPEFLRSLAGPPRVPAPFKYPPGVHYFVLELFDGDTPANMYVTIIRQ